MAYKLSNEIIEKYDDILQPLYRALDDLNATNELFQQKYAVWGNKVQLIKEWTIAAERHIMEYFEEAAFYYVDTVLTFKDDVVTDSAYNFYFDKVHECGQTHKIEVWWKNDSFLDFQPYKIEEELIETVLQLATVDNKATKHLETVLSNGAVNVVEQKFPADELESQFKQDEEKANDTIDSMANYINQLNEELNQLIETVNENLRQVHEDCDKFFEDLDYKVTDYMVEMFTERIEQLIEIQSEYM